MPNSFYKPPKQLIEEWPEVFEDLYMSTMPVMYLRSIQLEFVSGMVWEVMIEDRIKNNSSITAAEILFQILRNCRSELKRVNYQFDTERFKKDIKDLTDTFF